MESFSIIISKVILVPNGTPEKRNSALDLPYFICKIV